MAVLFRPHRELLADAMAEVRSVASKDELAASLHVDPAKLEIRPYCYDERIGWKTYIVWTKSDGVYGFTNAPLD